MTSIKNLMALLAAIPTPGSAPAASAVTPRQCGEVNVFYTGFPPYHPMVLAQGWDPKRVEYGLLNGTAEMVQAGYNVHVVWAGQEIPIGELEDRMEQSGVNYDITAVGFGMRGATYEPIIERFEDVVELYGKRYPAARKVFNHSPESFLWSVAHRVPLAEDCRAAGKPGKLIGYEEICDSRCDHKGATNAGTAGRDEL